MTKVISRVARLGILPQDLGKFLGLWDFSWDSIFPKNLGISFENYEKCSRQF